MKIFLQSGSDLLFLAGDGRLPQREFAHAADFQLEGELERQIVRKIRGNNARAISRGNVRHRAFFRTRRLFDSAPEAEAYIKSAERCFPRSGTVYFVTGEGTRKLRDAVVSPPAGTVQGSEARLQYIVQGGEFTPSEPELVVDELDGIRYRMVWDGGEHWFEVGFDSPYLLDGNEVDGWLDPLGLFHFRLHRSEDLVNWDFDWIPCPTSPEVIDGGYRYWARSRFPQDSTVKTGQLEISSGAVYGTYGSTMGNLSPDSRNNPFTALTIAGVSLALGGFPYTMPGDAASMQTALQSFYTGATVEATDATNWRIRVPDVDLSSLHLTNRLSWPAYLVEDMYGDLTLVMDGVSIPGTFVNAAGVRTKVDKQFARLGVSAGPNSIY